MSPTFLLFIEGIQQCFKFCMSLKKDTTSSDNPSLKLKWFIIFITQQFTVSSDHLGQKSVIAYETQFYYSVLLNKMEYKIIGLTH